MSRGRFRRQPEVVDAAPRTVEVHASPAECEAWAERLRTHHDEMFASVRAAEEQLDVERSFWSTGHVLRDTEFGQEFVDLRTREHTTH